MSMQIVNCYDTNKLFCTGSFTKLLTTYCALSFLSEKFDLKNILDDDNFFNSICTNQSSKDFLTIFQNKIKNKFSLRDICTFYAGLPYTFDVSEKEIENIELNHPFKHHCIPDEKIFLDMCEKNITPIYTNRCKFHYSELSIIFLGYLLEKVYDFKIEALYQKYVIDKFQLTNSVFSRVRPINVYCQNLSYKYDYPSVTILDHGYFCYSNGFYTTMNDMKQLLEQLLNEPIFLQYMTDIKNARAASPTIMNGLTVEIRNVDGDILFGYEGLSFSGCNLWCYSTKYKRGYITFTNDEEEAYNVYDLFGYTRFDSVPKHTDAIYRHFIETYHDTIEPKDIPPLYQGKYQRVNINESHLDTFFTVANNFITIRNPNEIQYDVIYTNGNYYVKGKDKIHTVKVGLIKSLTGNYYMYYDGTLYKKVSSLNQ